MIVDRILKIIELKGINKSRFYKKTGLSNGFLDKVKDIGASKIEDILNSFPDINPTWLLTGKGSMLVDSTYFDVTPVNQVNDAETKYESQATIDVNYEQVVKQLEEERELLKQSHKEIGILEFKLHSTTTELEKALKEIERLKKMVENVVEPKLMKKQ